jgi:Bacteriophage probable baseplate hub protein
MGLETFAKKNKNFYVPDFGITIGGSKIPAKLLKSITDIKVEDQLDVGASFTITFRDILDLSSGNFQLMDEKKLKPGNEVVLSIGYQNNLEEVLTGEIKSLEPEFSASDPPTLVVSGQDLSFDYLKKSSPAFDFVNKKPSEIIKEIANSAKLTPNVDPIKPDEPEPLRRKPNGLSYYDFLMILARDTGFKFRVEAKNMYFTEPDDAEKEVLKLTLGKDILSFSPRMRTSKLYKTIEVRGHNPEDPEKPFVGKATSKNKDATEAKVISNIRVISKAHADAIAQAEIDKSGATHIEGSISCIGLPQLKAGELIVIGNAGERFNGKYLLTSTTHSIGSSGYTTSMNIIGMGT